MGTSGQGEEVEDNISSVWDVVIKCVPIKGWQKIFSIGDKSLRTINGR